MVVLRLGDELVRRGHYVLFVGPSQGNGWLGERFADLGIETAPFTKRHPLDPRWVTDLLSTLRKHRIEVVHAHEFAFAVYGSAAAAWRGVPAVVTFHGAEGMTRALRRRIALRWSLSLGSVGVAVSAATRQQIENDLGLASDSIRLVRNGVPVVSGDARQIRYELAIPDEDIVVLAVGNLEERKGHLQLLRALYRLQQDGLTVPWRLVVAGGRGGPMMGPLTEFAATHGLADRVHLLTYRNDVPNLLAAADIFAMPSLWEGLPMALLEAMIAGKAIVASRTSGIPEAITCGVEGLLVKPGDETELASALWRLLSNPSLRQELGSRASARGLAEFTVEVMASRYEELYSIAV